MIYRPNPIRRPKRRFRGYDGSPAIAGGSPHTDLLQKALVQGEHSFLMGSQVRCHQRFIVIACSVPTFYLEKEETAQAQAQAHEVC